MELKKLQKRVLEISYKHNLSHIGSCLTALPIIKEIYEVKRSDEPFVLSSGHAGLALYVVLEAMGGRNAEEIFDHHGVHPDRCDACGIHVSTGSLGQGLPIAVGLALADRNKSVYCLISDGECAEGSIWEAMRIKDEQKLDNLKVYLNWNGWGAYKETQFPPTLTIDSCPVSDCEHKLKRNMYFPSNIENIRISFENELPFLKGLDAHYHVMTKEEYDNAQNILSGTV